MKTIGLIALSIFIPMKHLELVFVLTNFEITILLTLTFRFFIGFFPSLNFFFAISLS